MRILVTGASGMLGACLVQELQNNFEVFSTSNREFRNDVVENLKVFNLKDNNFSTLMNWAEPNIIIHCAAITDVNYCESHPEEAFLVNGISCQKIAKFAPQDTKIIYISTDAVFPPDSHLAREATRVDPQSVYGKSKELGEFFLRKARDNSYILRTTIVGLNKNQDNKKGFVEWILDNHRKGNSIHLFEDVIFTPISIWRFSKEIKRVIDYLPKQRIFHLAGNEICSKYDFGIALCEALGLSTDFVKAGSIEDLDNRSSRIKDQSMSSKLYEDTMNIQLPGLLETVRDIKKNLREDH